MVQDPEMYICLTKSPGNTDSNLYWTFLDRALCSQLHPTLKTTCILEAEATELHKGLAQETRARPYSEPR